MIQAAGEDGVDDPYDNRHDVNEVLLLFYCAGQRLTPHYRTLEVRPGRIKLELKYDCERDDTNSLLGVLMFGWDVVIANNE